MSFNLDNLIERYFISSKTCLSFLLFPLLPCRFLNPNGTAGRCEITDLKTEFKKFSNWDTTPNPGFDVHLRHDYCPEQRILTKNRNSPVLAVDPYPLYPDKRYYETNTLDKGTQPPAPVARQGQVQTEGKPFHGFHSIQFICILLSLNFILCIALHAKGGFIICPTQVLTILGDSEHCLLFALKTCM